jgi:predicted nucleotidyltransferase
MGLKEVILNLNGLKAQGIIGDYAICGGYACTFYEVSMPTYDLDVLAVLASEDDFHKLYEHYRTKGAKLENVYIYIENMPVQFLPNYISPLFNDAIKNAVTVEFEGVSSRFISVEYLVLLLLTSFRVKDKIRLKSLTGKVNKELMLSYIQRYSNDKNKLYERYQEVLARA